MLPQFDDDELDIAAESERTKARRLKRRQAFAHKDRWHLIRFFHRLWADNDDYSWRELAEQLKRPANFKEYKRTFMHTVHCPCGKEHQQEKHRSVKRLRRWKQERER